jgi:gliding motility-associated-like protein
VLCFGTSPGDITLTAGGGTPGYTYGWNPNVSTANTASNLPAASYGITVTDANTCTATITVVITEPAQLDVIATATDALCFGQANGTITATGSGGVTPFNYTASSGGSVLNSANGQFASVAAGTYMVYVNDNNQCVDSTSVTVNEPAQLTVLAVPVDVTCYHYTDGQIAVTSTGGTVPYTFSLSNGDQNGGGNFSSLATGTYTITVSDANNCTLTTSAVISEPDSVTLTVTPDPIKLNLGESIQLQTSTNWTGGSVTYNWQPAMGLDCYDCASPIFSGNYSAEYYVTMVTNTGCTGTSHVSVTVVPNYDVFVPNVFTPNGDGVNDTWNIFGNIPGIKQLEVAVFNRIGEKVFQTNDINFNWDGMYKGTFCPPGVYVYTAKFVWVNNHSDANYKGTVTLLR